MMGVSDAQIEEAARVAADTVKFSTYLHALQIDLESFKKMADEIGEYVSSPESESATASSAGEMSGTPEGRSEIEETLSDLREEAA